VRFLRLVLPYLKTFQAAEAAALAMNTNTIINSDHLKVNYFALFTL
jgi:hypothetical protein